MNFLKRGFEFPVSAIFLIVSRLKVLLYKLFIKGSFFKQNYLTRKMTIFAHGKLR